MKLILRAKCAAILIACLLTAGGVRNSCAGETVSLPPQIALQGKLQLPDGSALLGTRLWRVTFFDAATTGSQLGAVTTGTLTLSGAGRFSLALIPPTQILTRECVYYELAIDSAASPDNAINPVDVFPTRVRVNSVPYALNAGKVGGVAATDFWKLGGNVGSNPSTQFLGTADPTAFEIHTGGQRAMLVEAPTTTTAGANVIIGHPGNSAAAGTVSSTIAGGGSSEYNFGFGGPNSLLGSNSFIGGGVGNTAGFSPNGPLDVFGGRGAFVGGGYNNQGLGSGSVVGGGFGNVVYDGTSHATVAGGKTNGAQADGSFIGGGVSNLAAGPYSTITGGESNQALGPHSAVGGGRFNVAIGDQSVIAGGDGNITTGTASMIPGGSGNGANGANSFAAGYRAKALHNGAFVWSDASSNADFASTSANQFLIRAGGGVGINKTNPSGALDVNGDLYVRGEIIGKTVRSLPSAGLKIVRGIVQGNNTIFAGEGFTVTHPSTGSFNFTYTTPFSGPPAITVTPLQNGGSPVPLSPLLFSSANDSFAVQFFNSAGALTDPVYFHFIAIGP